MSSVRPIRSSEPSFLSRQVTRAKRFYFTQDTEAPHEELTILGGGWELVAPEYTINRDTFPWLALEFVAGGRGRLSIGGKHHPLARGAVFAYGPGAAHRIASDPKEPLSKYYLNFTGREGADLLAAIGLAPGCCRRIDNVDEVTDLIEAIIDEGGVARPRAQAVATLQLRILFLKLADVGDAPAGRLQSRQTLRRCLEFIDQNFLSVRTAADVARGCHVSVEHLSRLFKRHGYGSPYHYLTRRKMLHGAALLDSGELLVREVAERLEMDAFQFSRVFKRVHGVSPVNFLRRHGAPEKPSAESRR